MIVALIFSVGLVATLVWRHGDGPGGKKLIAAVAALALGIRLLTVFAINYYAYPIHDTGVWLADEASFFLATEKIWHDPLNSQLPAGLEHLGGDGYLGLTTTFAWLGRVADSNTFRVVNTGLGSSVVVLSMLVARRLFGPRAALIGGVMLAVWPTAILWSSTMLRDTFGAFAVVSVWWTLSRARQLGWFRTLGSIGLALVIAFSLRPYLGVAIVLGVIAWAIYPRARRVGRLRVATSLAALGVAAVVVLIARSGGVDSLAHELFYRQTVARMEVLGRLYTNQPDPGPGVPFKPGAAVVWVMPGGTTLGGIVQQLGPGDQLTVAFTDDSVRQLRTSDIVAIQRAPVSALDLVASTLPSVTEYFDGLSSTPDAASIVWVAAALGWDVVALIAIVAYARLRPDAREWLYPMCVIAATILALIAVPGAPGNAERHRATQTVPFLVVLAAGLLAQLRVAPSLGRASVLASTNSRNQSSSISSAQM